MNEAFQTALLPLLGAATTWLSVRAHERRKAREFVTQNPRRESDQRIVKVEHAVRQLDERVKDLEIGNRLLSQEVRDTRADVNAVAASVSSLREDIAQHTGKVDEAMTWIKAGLQERKD